METASPNPQQILDNEHLKLLSIFHYVVGGLAGLFACIPIIHLVLGLFFILAPEKFGHGNQQLPAFIGWFFVSFASVFILVGWTLAVLVLMAGRFIARRKYLHVLFCDGLCGVRVYALWNCAGGVHDPGPQSPEREGVV